MADTTSVSDISRSRYTLWSLYLLATSFVAAAVVHAVRDSSGLFVRGMEFAVVCGLAAALLASVRHTADRVAPAQFHYVGSSTLGLGLTTASLSLLASGIQVMQGYSLNEPLYYAMIMGAGGTVAGPYLGYYYARLQRSNAELNRRYEETAELNRRLDVANRVLRHNLRNNLTVIAGVTDELDRELNGGPMAERATLLDQRVEKLIDLSEKMAKMRQVWGSSERTTIELVPLMERLLADVRSTHPDVTVHGDLPDAATVTAHPKLETALLEVFRNAVEHNDTATLDIDVHVTETRMGTVEVRIADSGSGLPDIEQELFSGAEPSTSALDHGVGLGLWLVYWIVDQSGGDLSLANDDGAVVTLDLPRGDVDTGSLNLEQTLQEHRRATVTA